MARAAVRARVKQSPKTSSDEAVNGEPDARRQLAEAIKERDQFRSWWHSNENALRVARERTTHLEGLLSAIGVIAVRGTRASGARRETDLDSEIPF